MRYRILSVVPLITVAGGIAAYIYHNKTIADLKNSNYSDRSLMFMEGWKKGYDTAVNDWNVKQTHYEELKQLYANF